MHIKEPCHLKIELHLTLNHNKGLWISCCWSRTSGNKIGVKHQTKGQTVKFIQQHTLVSLTSRCEFRKKSSENLCRQVEAFSASDSKTNLNVSQWNSFQTFLPTASCCLSWSKADNTGISREICDSDVGNVWGSKTALCLERIGFESQWLEAEGGLWSLDKTCSITQARKELNRPYFDRKWSSHTVPTCCLCW